MTLTADQPLAEAAAEIVQTRAAAVFEHHPRTVLDLGDIEGVHRMRVATRRLRAALEVFGPSLPGKGRRRVTAEVTALAAALGARRDRDVQIAALTALRASSTGAERRAVSQLLAQLREEQLEANRELHRALRHARRIGLRERIARLVR
jgi:CHAD domain-containing protein